MNIHLSDEEAKVLKANVGIILNQHVRRESVLSPAFVYVLARMYDQLLDQLPLPDKPIKSGGAQDAASIGAVQARKPVGSVRPVIEIDKPNRA